MAEDASDAMESFDAFHDRYQCWVFNLALKLSNNRHDAEDVCQGAFLYVWRRGSGPANRLYGDPRKLFSTVIRHLCTEVRRKSRREKATIETGDSEGRTTERLEPDENHVVELLKGLPQRQCEIVRLRILEGACVSETARRIGLSPGAVRSTLHRALQRLRTFRSPYESQSRNRPAELVLLEDTRTGQRPSSTLDRAYMQHPERFVRMRTKPAALPSAVWINPPAAQNTAAAH